LLGFRIRNPARMSDTLNERLGLKAIIAEHLSDSTTD
jgi:hypothetical protein